MTASLKDKRILVGVCGSIAAFKACELVRALRKEGADVTVAMTRAATEFVGPATFAAFTTHPVLLEQFPPDPSAGVPHVDVAEMFDVVVIAPATADILGKAAHAIADDLVGLHLHQVPAVAADGPCDRLIHAGDAVEDRGLAGAVGSDDREDLALFHGERDAIQR